MTPCGDRVFLRHWGSYFKTRPQVEYWIKMLSGTVGRGWRSCLALERLPENAEWLDLLEQGGIQLVSCVRPRGQLDWNCISAVRGHCRRLKVDVFHCDNIHTSPMIGAWLAGVPIRVWLKHSMLAHFEECREPSFKERISLSTRITGLLATKVLCVSDSVADEVRRFGVSASKVLVRNNPRPTSVVFGKRDRRSRRKSLGIGMEDFVACAVGRAVAVKGWDVLLKSFSQVVRAVPASRLLLVGDYSAETAYYRELRQLCRDGKIEANVQFIGYLDDVTPALRAADVFVLPSRSEGNSYSLLEAMEEGLPCVATNVGSAPQLIQHGVNGFLVERLDVSGLARALIDLGRNREKCASFATHVTIPASIPTFEEYGELMRQDYETWLDHSVAAQSPIPRAAP